MDQSMFEIPLLKEDRLVLKVNNAADGLLKEIEKLKSHSKSRKYKSNSRISRIHCTFSV